MITIIHIFTSSKGNHAFEHAHNVHIVDVQTIAKIQDIKLAVNFARR